MLSATGDVADISASEADLYLFSVMLFCKVESRDLYTPSSFCVAFSSCLFCEQVYYIKRLRFIEDNAAQLEETWMSVARFPDLTVAHMQKSKFSYIENECGIKIIGTFETFSPTFPTPEIASILRISLRDPILKIQTQAVDSNSIPLDYSLLYSNIFEFQVKYFFPR